MAEPAENAPLAEPRDIDLRDPMLAGVLAWLWPGAGHLYQRRYAKGVLFMVCILGTYLAGFAIGGPNVVYASWTPTDRRLQYICQVGVGLPALPALVQAVRVIGRDQPPIRLFGEPADRALMAPPPQPVRPETRDALARWHERYGFRYEMGVLYTMIAGLLNVLAIYDAAAGPFWPSAKREEEPKPEQGESHG